jgi:hypothetical protein
MSNVNNGQLSQCCSTSVLKGDIVGRDLILTMKMAIFFTITEAKVGVFLRSVKAARISKSSNVQNRP